MRIKSCTSLRATIFCRFLPAVSWWRKTVDSYWRSCRNSRIFPPKKGGFPVPEKGRFLFRTTVAKVTHNGDQNLVHVWFSLNFGLRELYSQTSFWVRKGFTRFSLSPELSVRYTICPETITELSCFQFLRCKITSRRPKYFSQRPNSPEITVRTSLKSHVRITAPKNNSKTISVM